MATLLNRTHKDVATHALHIGLDPAERLDGELAPAVRALKEQGDGSIVARAGRRGAAPPPAF